MNNFKNASNRTIAQNWALSNYYKHPEFTNYANDFESCLDYIFYSNNKTIKVESLLETPSLHDINNDINR
jgi:mRNA deadenylase 3'-5' endonuclease subunit Ccr4